MEDLDLVGLKAELALQDVVQEIERVDALGEDDDALVAPGLFEAEIPEDAQKHLELGEVGWTDSTQQGRELLEDAAVVRHGVV